MAEGGRHNAEQQEDAQRGKEVVFRFIREVWTRSAGLRALPERRNSPSNRAPRTYRQGSTGQPRRWRCALYCSSIVPLLLRVSIPPSPPAPRGPRASAPPRAGGLLADGPGSATIQTQAPLAVPIPPLCLSVTLAWPFGRAGACHTLPASWWICCRTMPDASQSFLFAGETFSNTIPCEAYMARGVAMTTDICRQPGDGTGLRAVAVTYARLTQTVNFPSTASRRPTKPATSGA